MAMAAGQAASIGALCDICATQARPGASAELQADVRYPRAAGGIVPAARP
jgi:hypothetical protein